MESINKTSQASMEELVRQVFFLHHGPYLTTFYRSSSTPSIQRRSTLTLVYELTYFGGL